MNSKIRITTDVVAVRSHFLVVLSDLQCEIAQHALQAGEAEDDATIARHLNNAVDKLNQIEKTTSLIGYAHISAHAERLVRQLKLYMSKGLGSPYSSKQLTDVIIEIHNFVAVIVKLTEPIAPSEIGL